MKNYVFIKKFHKYINFCLPGSIGHFLDKYNRFAVIELEDSRKAINTKHREALDEIKRKQALAAKEAEAKKAKQ